MTSSSNIDFDPSKLPDLIDLPVYSEEHCSQELVDNVLKFFWEEKPDVVIDLAFDERHFLGNGHNIPYCRYQDALIDHLNTNSFFSTRCESNLAQIDLFYELSRRLRKQLNMFEIPVMGESIYKGDGKELKKLIHIEKFTRKLELSTDEVNELAEAVYMDNPELINEYCEQGRRAISFRHINQQFYKACDKKYSGTVFQKNDFRQEVRRRIDVTCELYMPMKNLLSSHYS